MTGAPAGRRSREVNDVAPSGSALDQLLRGEYRDPDGGSPIGVPIKAVHIERSLEGIEADLLAPYGLGRRLAVVSDPVTRTVLGRRVERALSSLATIVPVVLDAQPHADLATAATLRRAVRLGRRARRGRVRNHQRPLQIRGGEDGKPYVVFATAPSMNGYTSMNAAITVHGHKKTLPARRRWRSSWISRFWPRRRPDDSRRSRRFALPADGAGRLAAVPLSAGTPYRSAPFEMLADGRVDTAGRARGAPRPAISTPCERSRARSCCPASG
jgi:hypothetical protein